MVALENVIWIGGPAAAGKTTIARLLSRRHGFRWYGLDQHIWQHHDRAVAAGIPMPEYGPGDYDRTPMIHEDLQALPARPAVVAEGAPVTPAMTGLSPRAVWLMPSADEQQARLSARHPEGVHSGLTYGHQLITSQLSGAPVTIIVVDGQSVEETLACVEQAVLPHLQPGTSATTRSERASLIRWANRTSVDHALTAFARQDPQPDPDTVVRTYDCECGDPDCSAVVDLSVRDAHDATTAGRPPLLASTHR